MAPRSIRAATKGRLKELLESAPDLYDVQVLWGDETHSPDREHIRITDATGTVSIPTMNAGRKQRDDRFSVRLYVYSGVPGRAPQEAEERVEEMCHVIGDILADDFTLRDLDGLVAAELGEVTGPVSYAGGEGAIGWAGPIAVNCFARLI